METIIFLFLTKRIFVECSLIVNDRCERIKVATLCHAKGGQVRLKQLKCNLVTNSTKHWISNICNLVMCARL